MPMVIANNMAALSALNTLSGNTKDLTKALKQTSSGQRINSAGDDSSGYSISEKMRTQIRSLTQDKVNVQNGVCLCKVALGGLDNVKESVARMHDLAMQSTNDTMTDFDRQILEKEYDQLKDHIEEIVYDTTFNGLHPLYPTDGINSGKPHGTYSGTDIVFIIDETGSMSTPISNVKRNIENFADRLAAAGVDYRLGLVHYRDKPSATPIRKEDFTSDVSRFKDNLNKMEAAGGGDGPEMGLEAIMDMTNGGMGFDFREGAVKQFIVITDMTVHFKGDKSGRTDGYTIDEVNEALKAADVKLTYVTRGGGSDEFGDKAPDQWHKIAEGTGGLEIVIEDKDWNYSDYADKFEMFASKIIDDVPPDDEKWEEPENYLYIQEGTRANETITLHVYDNRLKALGIEETKVYPVEEAQKAMDRLDAALEIVLSHATSWGASASRLEYAEANIVTAHENTTNAESVIRDADMAKSMTDYTKNNVLTQAAQSMLAQANQNSSNVLSLLQ